MFVACYGSLKDECELFMVLFIYNYGCLFVDVVLTSYLNFTTATM
jgi:hypothetical protein